MRQAVWRQLTTVLCAAGNAVAIVGYMLMLLLLHTCSLEK